MPTNPEQRVYTAIGELERALFAYLADVEQAVPRAIAAKGVLSACSAQLTALLLDNLPEIAGPWRVVDMRDGEPIKIARYIGDGSAATVRRTGRRDFRWCAWAGLEVVAPPGSEYVDWPTLDEAKAACDAALREHGVLLMEGEP
jgi:hypothetical protein